MSGERYTGKADHEDIALASAIYLREENESLRAEVASQRDVIEQMRKALEDNFWIQTRDRSPTSDDGNTHEWVLAAEQWGDGEWHAEAVKWFEVNGSRRWKFWRKQPTALALSSPVPTEATKL